MATTEELQNMEGQTAVDVNGAKLGKIGQIYVDDQTSQPLWVTISTGMFGTRQSFAPLYGSRSDGSDLQLADGAMTGPRSDCTSAPSRPRPAGRGCASMS